MRTGAQLKESRHQQDAHAEPREGFESFLQGGDKAELVGQFQGPGGGGQEEQVDRREAPDPCHSCQHVHPIDECKNRCGGCIHDLITEFRLVLRWAPLFQLSERLLLSALQLRGSNWQTPVPNLRRRSHPTDRWRLHFDIFRKRRNIPV